MSRLHRIAPLTTNNQALSSPSQEPAVICQNAFPKKKAVRFAVHRRHPRFKAVLYHSCCMLASRFCRHLRNVLNILETDADINAYIFQPSPSSPTPEPHTRFTRSITTGAPAEKLVSLFCQPFQLCFDFGYYYDD